MNEHDTAPRGAAAAVVPAAGRGERLGPGAPKALREVAGLPILVHAVRALAAARSVGLVVVAAPPDAVPDVEALLAAHGCVARVVPGGATRQDSVRNALAAIPASHQIVLVHDAARPFVPAALVDRVADAVAGGADAVVPGVPVADTVKRVGPAGAGFAAEPVLETVPRAELRAVQTPQGFRRTVLAAAHARAGAADTATDDAGLVERAGVPVVVVPGDPAAFKVTRPLDLLLAEALLRAARSEEDAVDAR